MLARFTNLEKEMAFQFKVVLKGVYEGFDDYDAIIPINENVSTATMEHVWGYLHKHAPQPITNAKEEPPPPKKRKEENETIVFQGIQG